MVDSFGPSTSINPKELVSFGSNQELVRFISLIAKGPFGSTFVNSQVIVPYGTYPMVFIDRGPYGSTLITFVIVIRGL